MIRSEIKQIINSGDSKAINELLHSNTFWEIGLHEKVQVAGKLCNKDFYNEALEIITNLRKENAEIDKQSAHTLQLIEGDCLLQAEQFSEAVRIYEEILSRSSTSTSHANKALAHWELREYDKALDHYQKSLLLDPENVIALRGAGEMLNKMEKYLSAAVYLRRAVLLSPDYAPAYTALGVSYYNMENWIEAYRALKKAVQLDPEDIIAKRGIEKIDSFF